MDACRFEGTPRSVGLHYGKSLAEKIQRNIRMLIYGEGLDLPPVPVSDGGFRRWRLAQQAVLGQNWPWLLEEMAAVAEGAGQSLEDILLLNLRAWQYANGDASRRDACSSVAVTLSDGTIACAGSLDDPPGYYCGAVVIQYQTGYPFVTFPITGTSWASRGINSAGLAVGASSQQLPGLRALPNTMNQDLAVRVLLRTAANTDDVRRFCQQHPFTLNMVCVDADGGVLCGHQTAAGWYELSARAPYALTNHVADGKAREWLTRHGVRAFPESATTRPRLDKLLDFLQRREQQCIAEDVRTLVADREGGASAICPSENVVVTYANPVAEPGVLWTACPQMSDDVGWQAIHITETESA